MRSASAATISSLDEGRTTGGTPLLTAAKAKGCSVMTGRELAIHQAAEAFELFTGLQPSIAVIGNAFDAVMASRYPAVIAVTLQAPDRA